MKPPSDKDLTAVGPIPVGERKTVRLSGPPVVVPIDIGSEAKFVWVDEAGTEDVTENVTQVFGCRGDVLCICADCLLANLGHT